jgi:alkylhydroperoxidase/carboxymuconolactone decarboxylase family protein YurZ
VTVAAVIGDPNTASISDKLKALLKIAAKTQAGGKQVTRADVEAARAQGATDIEIHDTVLIAAAFCMYNRYVDGLDTWQPDNDELYDKMGEQRAREGYGTPPAKVSELVASS